MLATHGFLIFSRLLDTWPLSSYSHQVSHHLVSIYLNTKFTKHRIFNLCLVLMKYLKSSLIVFKKIKHLFSLIWLSSLQHKQSSPWIWTGMLEFTPVELTGRQVYHWIRYSRRSVPGVWQGTGKLAGDWQIGRGLAAQQEELRRGTWNIKYIKYRICSKICVNPIEIF